MSTRKYNSWMSHDIAIRNNGNFPFLVGETKFVGFASKQASDFNQV